jgi:hypothetical protein
MVRQSIIKVAHIFLLLQCLVFVVLIMDNINGNMARKPDPPGADYFEVCRVKSHFESDCSVSTMTDPPPSESHPANRSKCSQLTYNEVGCSPVGCSPADTSNDPPMTDEASLSTVSFPYHSFMAKYIKEYASTKGFLPLHKCKYYFNGEATTELFPGDKSYHSLESNPSQKNRHP